SEEAAARAFGLSRRRMRGSQKRVTREEELLLRYVDGEMSPVEAQRFRARLAESPALRQKAVEMQQIGALLRKWARSVEPRAQELVEPTLRRVQAAERKSARWATAAYAAAALAVVILPWSQRSPATTATTAPATVEAPSGAAIERLEAADK